MPCRYGAAKAIFDLLKADEEVVLSDADLEALFDLGYHLLSIFIFNRVFGES